MKEVKSSFFGLLLLLCMLIPACSGRDTISSVEPQDGLRSSDCHDAPGIVVLAFEKETTDESILDFLALFGLKPAGDIYGVSERWVAAVVPEKTEDEWIKILLQSEIVVAAERDKICPVH